MLKAVIICAIFALALCHDSGESHEDAVEKLGRCPTVSSTVTAAPCATPCPAGTNCTNGNSSSVNCSSGNCSSGNSSSVNSSSVNCSPANCSSGNSSSVHCSSDSDCAKAQKCCQTSCGLQCVDPEFKKVCDEDVDCPATLVCCKKTCVRTVLKKPSKIHEWFHFGKKEQD